MLFLVYVLANIDLTRVSGKVVLDLGADYQEGKPLDGSLKLFLTEGELIPASSKLIFETPEQKYEYSLENLVSDELIEGDFYVAGKPLPGAGPGFGKQGIDEISPPVYFSLNIYSTPEESVSEGEAPEEESGEATEEEPAEETFTEETPSEQAPEETTEEEPVEETTEEAPEEEPEEALEPAPGLPEAISNFFLALSPTGQVTLELDTSIDGEVSAENDFKLELLEGQTAEIISGSVRTDSVELSENDISLKMDGNTLIVTTDYSEVQHGFGEDYLGSDERVLDIALSDLNMIFNQGTLKVSLVYEEEEIVSLTTILSGGGVTAKEGTGEEVVGDQVETIPSNQTIPTTETQPETELKGLPANLTDAERAILMQEFGDESIEITKAKAGEQRITIRYELENYWFEATYDVSLSKEELTEQMDADKAKWLKDIVKSLSKEERVEEDIEEFLGNYSI